MMVSKFKKRVGTLILAATMGVAAVMPATAGIYKVIGRDFSLNETTYYKASVFPAASESAALTVLFYTIPQKGDFFMGFRTTNEKGQWIFAEKKRITLLGNSVSILKEFPLKKGVSYQAFILGESAIGEVKEFRYLEK